jgi:hypothetical protein
MRARSTIDSESQTGFLLHFSSLFAAGGEFAFPCNAQGQVDIDKLSERARNNYFYARAVMGRELAYPELRRAVSAQA